MTKKFYIIFIFTVLSISLSATFLSENFEIYENTRDELFQENKSTFIADFNKYKVPTQHINLLSFYEWPKNIPGKVCYILLIESDGFLYVYTAQYFLIDDSLDITGCPYEIAKKLFPDIVTKQNYLTTIKKVKKS